MVAMMGAAYKYPPLTVDEMRLIQECKAERAQIRARIADLRAGSPKRHFGEIQRLKRDLHELTDEVLAVKFEVSKYQIQRC
jgi:hypothetical protein